MNLKTITLACAICAILQFCMVIIWTLCSMGYMEHSQPLYLAGNIVLMLLYLSIGCFFFTIFKNQK